MKGNSRWHAEVDPGALISRHARCIENLGPLHEKWKHTFSMASAVLTGTVDFSTMILLLVETEAIMRAAPSLHIRTERMTSKRHLHESSHKLQRKSELLDGMCSHQYVRSAAFPAPTPRVLVGVFTLQSGVVPQKSLESHLSWTILQKNIMKTVSLEQQ